MPALWPMESSPGEFISATAWLTSLESTSHQQVFKCSPLLQYFPFLPREALNLWHFDLLNMPVFFLVRRSGLWLEGFLRDTSHSRIPHCRPPFYQREGAVQRSPKPLTTSLRRNKRDQQFRTVESGQEVTVVIRYVVNLIPKLPFDIFTALRRC